MSARDLVPKTPDSLTETELEGAFPAVLARAPRGSLPAWAGLKGQHEG